MGESTQDMAGTPDPKDTGMPSCLKPTATRMRRPYSSRSDWAKMRARAANRTAKTSEVAGPGRRRGVAVIVLGAGIGGYAYALNNVNSGAQAALL